jgi:hypothetical protein
MIVLGDCMVSAGALTVRVLAKRGESGLDLPAFMWSSLTAFSLLPA